MSTSKRFVAANGDFASPIILFGVGAVLPVGLTTRPRRVIVEYDIGDVLAYVDDSLVTTHIVFPATGIKMLRMKPTKLETSTTCTAVTVVW